MKLVPNNRTLRIRISQDQETRFICSKSRCSIHRTSFFSLLNWWLRYFWRITVHSSFTRRNYTSVKISAWIMVSASFHTDSHCITIILFSRLIKENLSTGTIRWALSAETKHPRNPCALFDHKHIINHLTKPRGAAPAALSSLSPKSIRQMENRWFVSLFRSNRRWTGR